MKSNSSAPPLIYALDGAENVKDQEHEALRLQLLS